MKRYNNMEKHNTNSTVYVAPDIKVVNIEPAQVFASSTQTFNLGDEGEW